MGLNFNRRSFVLGFVDLLIPSSRSLKSHFSFSMRVIDLHKGSFEISNASLPKPAVRSRQVKSFAMPLKQFLSNLSS